MDKESLIVPQMYLARLVKGLENDKRHGEEEQAEEAKGFQSHVNGDQRNDGVQADLFAHDFRLDDIANHGDDGIQHCNADSEVSVAEQKSDNRPGDKLSLIHI